VVKEGPKPQQFNGLELKDVDPNDIPTELKKQVRLFTGHFMGSPYLWQIPSNKLYCEWCGYEPDAYEALSAKEGDNCPGATYSDFMSVKTKHKNGSYFDPDKDVKVLPNCKWEGSLIRRWTIVDTWNYTKEEDESIFMKILEETEEGRQWKEKGVGKEKGEAMYHKWYTVKGAHKRIPEELKPYIGRENEKTYPIKHRESKQSQGT